jgi:hypothetical protein
VAFARQTGGLGQSRWNESRHFRFVPDYRSGKASACLDQYHSMIQYPQPTITLSDAAQYLTEVPPSDRHSQEWLAAVNAVLFAAEEAADAREASK